MTLKRTPLYDEHLKLGAKMVGFAGWEMPIQYKNLIEEHKAVRMRAGMFDAGHMGVVKFTDTTKLLSVQREIFTRYIDDMEVSQIRYNRLRNSDNGIVDDILIYKDYEHYLAVFNAVNTDKDLKYFADLGVECELMGLHVIAIQGPEAEAIVQKYAEEELDKMKYFTFIPLELDGIDAIACKAGYTGERGFEIMTAAENCPAIWQMFLQEGVIPCGLGARDTLRIEAGMPLYGHELKDSWTSEQSDSIVGLKLLDKAGVPRQGYEICDKDGKQIGEITSGTFSPTLNEPIAMAYLTKASTGSATKNPQVFIKIRDKMIQAQVIDLPFYSNVRKSNKKSESSSSLPVQ